ncbi:MAG: hypothetical protein V1722_05130 [Candidatus Micrarchaeota archaeon]
MTYDDFSSGNAWIKIKETNSISGTRLDGIFGALGIGSPHGHYVSFNEKQIYVRNIPTLIAIQAGNTVTILEI